MNTSSRTHDAMSDTDGVLRLVADLDRHDLADVRGSLPTGDLVVARAPGRLDVMGGIADYSGSLVLELPTREATHAVIGRDESRILSVVTVAPGGRSARRLSMSIADLEELVDAEDYSSALEYFRGRPDGSWGAYVLGAFVVLARERGVRFTSGARLLVVSDVPEGKGVSSSAAVEVASMAAVAAAYDVALQPRELAILCQKIENLVVGAPCGVMDQMTAACGEADRLLALKCQPAEIEPSVSIPPDLAFWGIDSGVRHAVVGEDYGTVRTAAFMGYRMIADFAGLPFDAVGDGRVSIRDFRWGGYLVNVTPEELRARFESLLPEAMTGDEFLSRFEGTTDAVTRVQPERTYPVRAATRHPVLENSRVERFRRLIEDPSATNARNELGALMYASHDSYSACGLGSDATDLLVKLVRSAGPAKGLYGAKITGGGSGGTVAVLGESSAGESISGIADDYEARTGRAPYVFAGSSPGAAAFGTLRITRVGGTAR